jgi:hypothetical protein
MRALRGKLGYFQNQINKALKIDRPHPTLPGKSPENIAAGIRWDLLFVDRLSVS